MYLKKIEAQGFKSFANKTVLEFSPGIMAIVGPNGSGKSNVADAVRWVLGEQSAKQLRGSNMQDVIFAGTESRKPQGYAYVTLTLDNADHMLPMDFDEIVITRRVYRSGESEYLINGNACRLRDINELFYDTGVGKEGYSIIGQGQIDKILSTKPEDRRELFDEAAGIVKFKKRKDISLKKLEEEQNNLLRVSDILAELEKQVGPLHRQAETAKTYLKLRDELKTYEVGMFFRESESLKEKLRAVNEKLEIARADFETTSSKAEEMRNLYEQATRSREALDRQIERDRDELSGLSIEKENLDGRIHVLDEQVGTLKAAQEELLRRLAGLDEKRRGINKDKEKFTLEKGELNDKLDAADDAISHAEAAIDEQDDVIREKQHQLEVKQSKLLEEIRSQADITADTQGISIKLSQATEAKDAAEEACRSLNAGLEELTSAIRTLSAEKDELSEKIYNAEQGISGIILDIETSEKKLHQTDEALTGKISEYRVAASRLESLKNMAERYDGYGDSIKHVMNAAAGNKAVRGVVADLISTRARYETAIETALGGHIQNVVTEDETTAKEMVAYLKRERLGRVTFLPMDAVKGRENMDRSPLSEQGIIDTANNLVTYDREYEGIVDNLLGRIFVAETITHALAVARKYRYKLHIVTLEGEYLAPGGSITGGSYKSNSSLLSRKREIEALEKSMSVLSGEGEVLKTQREDLTARISSLKQQQNMALESLTARKSDYAAMATKLDNQLSEKTRMETELTEKHNAQNEMLMLITELNSKVVDSEQAAKEAGEAEARRKAESEALIADIASERDKLKTMNDELTALRLDYSKLEERDNFLLENIERINRDLELIDEEKMDLLRQSDPEGLQTMARQREKDKLIRRKDELTGRIDELTAGVTEAGKSRDDFARQQESLLADRDANSGRAASLDKEILRLSNQQERINEAIDSQVAYLWNEYELTPMEAEARKYEGTESAADIRKLISDHKDQIRELGPVNVNAIDEEKEVGERYTFLSAQHEDLVKARDSILQVIADLDEGMRRQFEEKFAAIKKEFDRVFKDLFGGGTGTLELLPEEDGDILKCGVSIIAQPPGKKLQNMMQLSGGEKALTAIALIFAIQNLKPSPFCLLDEIEAALDETNVDRFAGYLGRLKQSTQFITITHRRGTMEKAEKLYGITMQERGISTVVSVNLASASEQFGEKNE